MRKSKKKIPSELKLIVSDISDITPTIPTFSKMNPDKHHRKADPVAIPTIPIVAGLIAIEIYLLVNMYQYQSLIYGNNFLAILKTVLVELLPLLIIYCTNGKSRLCVYAIIAYSIYAISGHKIVDTFNQISRNDSHIQHVANLKNQITNLNKQIDAYMKDDWKSASLKMIKQKIELEKELNLAIKSHFPVNNLLILVNLGFELMIRLIFQISSLILVSKIKRGKNAPSY